MKLGDYLDLLSWSQVELARRADISPGTVARALKEGYVTRNNAMAICEALSKALHRRILVSEIDELHIRPLHRKKPTPPPIDQSS